MLFLYLYKSDQRDISTTIGVHLALSKFLSICCEFLMHVSMIHNIKISHAAKVAVTVKMRPMASREH